LARRSAKTSGRRGTSLPARHCALPPVPARATREFTVAEGRFAPGHLAESTQVIAFDLVDAVLGETRCAQRRLRDLPSRVGVCFLLAMCLFPEVGHRLVRHKSTAALTASGSRSRSQPRKPWVTCADGSVQNR
jgi:hypothetical protein